MNNRTVHFEIPCDKPEETIRFFEKVFGWTFQRFGEEQYWFAITGDESTPGINGGIMKRKNQGQPVVNSIWVKSLDESVRVIEAHGGKIVVPKMVIPTVGWVAYFTDPDGNIHGIWQEDSKA